MVRSETPEPVGADRSLGDLVALAAKDVSQLIRYEIDLAKAELRGDLRRVGLAGALTGVALGIWTWAAFLIVAGTCVLLAGLAVGIAILALRRLSGLRETRKSVTEGFGMLRHDEHQPSVSGDGERPEISRDGRQAEIAAREAK